MKLNIKQFLIIPLLFSLVLLYSACSGPSVIDAEESQNIVVGNPWLITPIAYVEITEDCIGEEPNYFNGFKYLYVFYAAENNSSQYAKLLRVEGITISTQEGYVYDIEGGNMRAGDNSHLIPPGFKIRGSVAPINSTGSNGGNKFIFRVGATTSGYTIHIPGYPSISLDKVPNHMSMTDVVTLFGGDPRGSMYNTEGVNCFENNNSINLSSSFPTNSPDSNFYYIGDTIAYGSDGEIQVVSYSIEGTTLSINVMYSNKSGGYDTTIPASKYVVGNDGYTHSEYYGANGPIGVGPNQQKVYTHTFNIPIGLRNIKLVFGNGVDAVINIE